MEYVTWLGLESGFRAGERQVIKQGQLGGEEGGRVKLWLLESENSGRWGDMAPKRQYSFHSGLFSNLQFPW